MICWKGYRSFVKGDCGISNAPCRKIFKWPDRKDECVYPLEAVVSRINSPVAGAGHLGQFSFDYFN